MTVPVLLSGILAWQWQFAGRRLSRAFCSGSWFSVLCPACSSGSFASSTVERSEAGVKSSRIPLEMRPARLVVLTGHFGGFLGGVNGARYKSGEHEVFQAAGG